MALGIKFLSSSQDYGIILCEIVILDDRDPIMDPLEEYPRVSKESGGVLQNMAILSAQNNV